MFSAVGQSYVEGGTDGPTFVFTEGRSPPPACSIRLSSKKEWKKKQALREREKKKDIFAFLCNTHSYGGAVHASMNQFLAASHPISGQTSFFPVRIHCMLNDGRWLSLFLRRFFPGIE